MKHTPWIVSAVLAVLLGLTWLDSRAKLEQKDAELESLRQQQVQLVNEANSKLEAANSKVKQLAEEANSQIQQLRDEANEKLQQANQREVPVTVAFRKALMSNGYVAMLTNTSGQPIAVNVEARRPPSGQSRVFDVTLDSNHKREIGEREGWAFVSGDTLTVSNPGQKPLTFTFR